MRIVAKPGLGRAKAVDLYNKDKNGVLPSLVLSINPERVGAVGHVVDEYGRVMSNDVFYAEGRSGWRGSRDPAVRLVLKTELDRANLLMAKYNITLPW